MTEEEFKKTMSKVIGFVVIALIILVIIGVVVFNTSGKQTSIFASNQEKEKYKKKIQENNSYNITEGIEQNQELQEHPSEELNSGENLVEEQPIE